MITCPNCGNANADSNRFCSDCGQALVAVEEPKTARKPGGGLSAADLARTIATQGGSLQKGRKADVLFVLDTTGSMQGEIDAIRDVITDFADEIESDGVRLRVGLLAFRDRLIDEEPEVLQFDGSPFTEDPRAFRREVSRLEATGGGDIPESSLDALMLALRQPFAPDRNKAIVLVTDAPPHIPDKDTKNIDEVVAKMKETGIDQCYLAIRTQDPDSQVYLKLYQGSGARGMAFDLEQGFRSAGRFKKTLLSLAKTISEGTR
jgi:Mg-chelatase subunit ChlD